LKVTIEGQDRRIKDEGIKDEGIKDEGIKDEPPWNPHRGLDGTEGKRCGIPDDPTTDPTDDPTTDPTTRYSDLNPTNFDHGQPGCRAD
jgi:hypothetical protein